MKYYVRLAFLLVLPLYGCGFAEWNVELYVQKIEGTSKCLYKYDAWGGRDSHIAGYVVLDSTEKFEINSRNDLGFYYLQEVPTQRTIRGVSNGSSGSGEEEDKLAMPVFIPIKKARSKSQNMEIINLIYQD